jgi:peroxiredoxin Q/BCP
VAPLPAVGAPAPDFTLPASGADGATVTLSALRGRPVVVYFYPRDDTPTCTAEACGFRDRWADVEAAGAVVLGISTDPPRSHDRFRRKFALPFPLLSDEDHRVADAWGVWGEKTLFGRRYMGIRRTTFVVDRRGRVARVFEAVRSAGHADEVLEAVRALPARRVTAD